MTGRQLAALAVLPVALLLCVQTLMAERDGRALWRGQLFGPDAYMRLVRVAELHEQRDWYHQQSERSNTPYGETLHWTRPLDGLLLAGALVAAPVAGFDTALHWWGVAIGPVLHVATLATLMWAMAPLLGSRGVLWLGLLLPFQLVLTYQFAAGRPDHHGLLSLALVWACGCTVRLVDERSDAKSAAWAALAVALSVWVSIEGLLAAVLVLLALAVGWVAVGESFARKAWVFCATTTFALTLELLVERAPSQYAAIDYDTLSVVHLTLFALLTALALVAMRLEARSTTVGRRLAIAAAAGAFLVVVCRTLFPKLMAGPLADMDPRLADLWFRHVMEIRPLVDPQRPALAIARFATHLGPVLIALPFLVHLVRCTEGPQRRGWLVIALGLALSIPPSLMQIRWSAHAQIFVLAPYAAALTALTNGTFRLPLLGGTCLRVAWLTVFATGFLVAGTLLEARSGAADPPGDCAWTAATRHLDAAFPSQRRVATFIFRGPELLYRTSHAVVATPYHRNAGGMLDLIDLFSAEDMDRARAIVDERGLELVLICADEREARDYRSEQTPTLLMRLEQGEAPRWLRPVALPDELAGQFRLYEVN